MGSYMLAYLKVLMLKIETKPPAVRHPSIIIYDVPNSTPEDHLQQALTARFNLSKPLKIRFKLNGRDKETSHWVLEATGEIVEKAKSFKKVPLNWTMHNVKEFFHIRKCTKCQGFGHLSKDCRDVRPTCGNCAGRHETRRCRSPQIACINCSHYNVNFGTTHNIRHKASDIICPCYQDEVAAYRRTRDY